MRFLSCEASLCLLALLSAPSAFLVSLANAEKLWGAESAVSVSPSTLVEGRSLRSAAAFVAPSSFSALYEASQLASGSSGAARGGRSRWRLKLATPRDLPSSSAFFSWDLDGGDGGDLSDQASLYGGESPAASRFYSEEDAWGDRRDEGMVEPERTNFSSHLSTASSSWRGRWSPRPPPQWRHSPSWERSRSPSRFRAPLSGSSWQSQGGNASPPPSAIAGSAPSGPASDLRGSEERVLLNREATTVATTASASEEHWAASVSTHNAPPTNASSRVHGPSSYENNFPSRSEAWGGDWSASSRSSPSPSTHAQQVQYSQSLGMAHSASSPPLRWKFLAQNPFARYFPVSADTRHSPEVHYTNGTAFRGEGMRRGPGQRGQSYLGGFNPLARTAVLNSGFSGGSLDAGLLLKDNEALSPGFFARLEDALPLDIPPELMGNLVEGSRRKLMLFLDFEEGPPPIVSETAQTQLAEEEEAQAEDRRRATSSASSSTRRSVPWFRLDESVEAARKKLADHPLKLEQIEFNAELLLREASYRRRRLEILNDALSRHGLSRDPSSWLCREFVYCRHLALRQVIFALWRHAALEKHFKRKPPTFKEANEPTDGGDALVSGVSPIEAAWRAHVLRTSSIDLATFPVSQKTKVKKLSVQSRATRVQEMELGLLERKNDFFMRRFDALSTRLPSTRFHFIPFKGLSAPHAAPFRRMRRQAVALNEEEEGPSLAPPTDFPQSDDRSGTSAHAGEEQQKEEENNAASVSAPPEENQDGLEKSEGEASSTPSSSETSESSASEGGGQEVSFTETDSHSVGAKSRSSRSRRTASTSLTPQTPATETASQQTNIVADAEREEVATSALESPA